MPDGTPAERRFELSVDAGARAWLDSRPGAAPLVIDYDVHRCCGGGKICEVRVRERTGEDGDGLGFSAGTLAGGGAILIDRRAAARLPARFGLTVRGRGKRARLDLSLEPEQWGDLLYT